jgi:hypothetical protein
MKNMLMLFLLAVSSGCGSPYPEAPISFAGQNGEDAAIVEIHASPTPAWIFVNGDYAGITPLDYEMQFDSETRSLEVSAVPMYGSQTRQSKRLHVPPLPKRLHFFMNTPPLTASSSY